MTQRPPSSTGIGYVLHARPYRETSLLVELLVSGLGRVGAVVRGVRGGRAGARRAALQPLQPLHLELRMSGELAQLVQAEPASAALPLRGDALLSAFYVNELCVRLLPRDEPVDTLFVHYADCLAGLQAGGAIGWPLRRFELRLLETLGYAPDLGGDSAGEPLMVGRDYLVRDGRLCRVPADTARALPGAALICLVHDTEPPGAELAALRRWLRGLIEPHLGGRPLRSWGLLAEFQQVDPTAFSAAP